MNRSITETARILSVEPGQVETWASLFKGFLSKRATATDAQPRCFTDSDVLVLAYVSTRWEAEPDLQAIEIGLEEDEHLDERFYELLYLNSPILQEPPEELDETWRHGVLWVGGHGQERFELARNYRYVAETMLEEALRRGEAADWICPVLFAYRHALELYLKSLGSINKNTHSLALCVKLVEEHHGVKLNGRLRGWIEELDRIDPHPGTAFRYEEGVERREYAEYWVDLHQFKFAMGKVFQMIDMAVLNTWGKPATGTSIMTEPHDR